MPGPPSGLSTENDGTIDPKNFATIRTTSIVQREQKEHLQEDMHDQMSGYKRLRRDHQAALSRYSVRNLEKTIRFSLKSLPSERFVRPEMSQIKAEISLRTNVKLICHKNVGLQ